MNDTKSPMSCSSAVVITGASSGIGRATAMSLAGAGYLVFAGVRRPSDGEKLQALSSGVVRPLILDVTDAGSVAAAASKVATVVGSAGIQGLINNAGIGFVGPMEAVPLDALRRLYEVNVFGQVAVLQAFLPVLRRGGGRLINIGSIGDRLTPPYTGPLSSSKQAFASITDALRLELRSSGIRVVLIEPAAIRTEAIDKVEDQAEDLIGEMSSANRDRYAASFLKMTRRGLARERAGSSPDRVAAVIEKALTAPNPKARYLVGRDSRRMALLARWMPVPILDRIMLQVLGMPTELDHNSELSESRGAIAQLGADKSALIGGRS